MKNFWGNFDDIENKLLNLSTTVEKTLNCTLDTLEIYIKKDEITSEIKENCELTFKLENEADKIRRKIINDLISGQMMPNTRIDFINLIENIDEIANESEHLLKQIILPQFNLNKINPTDFKKITDEIKKQPPLLIKSIKYLFDDINKAYNYVHQIEKLESTIDNIETDMLKKLRNTQQYSQTEKIIYRDFINNTANLGNIIEDTGDRIELIIAARKG
ncbi:MAG: DUF47 domain-containing protein [Bacillota bacterium]